MSKPHLLGTGRSLPRRRQTSFSGERREGQMIHVRSSSTPTAISRDPMPLWRVPPEIIGHSALSHPDSTQEDLAEGFADFVHVHMPSDSMSLHDEGDRTNAVGSRLPSPYLGVPPIYPHSDSPSHMLPDMEQETHDMSESSQSTIHKAPMPSISNVRRQLTHVTPPLPPLVGGDRIHWVEPGILPSLPSSNCSLTPDEHGQTFPISAPPSSRPQTGSSLSEPSSDWSSSYDESLSGAHSLIRENSYHFSPQTPLGSSINNQQGRLTTMNNIRTFASRLEKGSQGTGPPVYGLPGGEPRKGAGTSGPHTVTNNDITMTSIEDAWRALHEKKSEVAAVRADMREKRTEMRRLRRRMNTADNSLMSTARVILVQSSGLKDTLRRQLNQEMTTVQALRSEYQLLETSYGDLEDDLNKQEKQIDETDVEFWDLLRGVRRKKQPHQPVVGPCSDKIPAVPHELRGIAAHGPEEHEHPHLAKLRLAVAAVRRDKEKHHDLLQTKDNCDLEVLGIVDRTRQSISKEVSDFLAGFPARDSALRQAVLEGEQEVRRWRILCEEEDLLNERQPIPNTDIFAMGMEQIELDDERSILGPKPKVSHGDYPELLSQAVHLLDVEDKPLTPSVALREAIRLSNDDHRKQYKISAAAKEYNIEQMVWHGSAEDSQGKSGFVSRWLLHSLQISHYNAFLLGIIFVSTQRLTITNTLQWQYDVLYYWDKDGTLEAAQKHFGEKTESSLYYSVHAPSRAVSDNAAPKRLSWGHGRRRSSGAWTMTGLDTMKKEGLHWMPDIATIKSGYYL